MADYAGLTVTQCVEALKIVHPSLKMAMDSGVVKRPQGFLVVLNPTIQREPKYKLPDKKFADEVALFSTFFGEPDKWDHPFSDIALSKAFISWQTGLPSRLVQLEYPYLYKKGMTKYGGSAVDPGGLVVAFSGVEEWFDQMFSEMMLAAIKGVCLHEMHGPDGVMADANITYIGDGQ